MKPACALGASKTKITLASKTNISFFTMHPSASLLSLDIPRKKKCTARRHRMQDVVRNRHPFDFIDFVMSTASPPLDLCKNFRHPLHNWVEWCLNGPR